VIEFGHVQQKLSAPTMSGKEGMNRKRKKEGKKKKEFSLCVKQPYGGDRGSNFKIFCKRTVS
jgi:hypothetical protein